MIVNINVRQAVAVLGWAGLGHWGPDGDTGTWTQEWGHSSTGADWARNADHGFWIKLQTNRR